MTSVSDGDDVSMTSSTQNESKKVNHSTLVEGDPPEGKTTAVVAVMRGNSKHGYHRHRSNKHYKKQIVRVLLDSGSDGDLVFVNKDKPMLLPYSKRLVPQSWNTSNGIFQTKRKARVELNFFDYSDSKRYYSEPDVVEYNKDSKPQYDLILGNETMKELGIVLDFKSKTITIDEITLPMRNINLLQGSSTLRALKLNNSLAKEPLSTLDATNRATRILDAKYAKADLQSIVKNNCQHLSADNQKKLLQLLVRFESLFDGTLGDWRTKPVSFQLKEGASPYHGRAFPVPKIHKDVLIKEIERLCKLGVLERQHYSEWASPSFIVPKKNGTVRFLSDFREVNKRLIRKPFPIPKISTVLQELEGFTFATALDLNMGYYTIRLDPDASKICTIIFPWGKYSYKRLPMGIAGSPDIFQAEMMKLMESLEYVRAYIDDLLCISRESFDDHLDKLEEVLKRLRDAGLKVNADKSTFCALEIEYLGYILSKNGIKPQSNKVQAILAIHPPTGVKQLRHFLGMVQYYRDLWARRSDMLAPLTELVGECGQTKVTKAKGTKKVPWHWDEVHQRAFDHVKATIARDVVLAYPDYSEVFEIYTDASSKQLGAVITQKNRPIAFFSRKLTDAQRKYSVTEIELLAIVETLKEFKGMLWGQPVKVYTDHKNLMRDALGLTSDRVYRWRLLLEEYGPEIVYIKGIHNTVADAISRLEYDPSVNKTAESYLMTKVKGNSRSVQRQNWLTLSKHWCKVETDDTTKHEDLNLVFATHGEEDEIYPLTIIEIAEAQKKDRNLKIYYKRNAKTPEKGMSFQLIEDTKVLCKEDKLVIPASLQHRAVSWYHHYLQHPGHSRLEETLRSVMYWKGMRHTIRKYVKSCRSCQVNKRHSQKYGHVPPKLVITIPWRALCVDLIGPYTLNGKDGSSIDFMCLTMIDPATSWFEIVELPKLQRETSGSKVTTKNTKAAEPYFDKTNPKMVALRNNVETLLTDAEKHTGKKRRDIKVSDLSPVFLPKIQGSVSSIYLLVLLNVANTS